MARGASVQWTGLIELKQQLGEIPANLLASSRAAVELATNQVAVGLRSSYPQGPTGNLRRGVRTTVKTTRTGGRAGALDGPMRTGGVRHKPRYWKRNQNPSAP